MPADDPTTVLVQRLSDGPFAHRLGRRRVAAGQMYLGGDEESDVDGLLVVRSGCLRAFVSHGGRELTLFVLGPGDATRVNADSMLEARRDSEIVFVPMAVIREFARLDPDLVMLAMPVFDRLLERSLQRIEEMAFHDVEHRLIRALCDTAKREGLDSEQGIVLASPPNAEDLASEIGATRQSVSTVMADLVRRGILRRFGQRSVVISDMVRLRGRLAAAAG